MQNLQFRDTLNCDQTNRLLVIYAGSTELARLDVSNHKIQYNPVSYRERCYTTQAQVDNAAIVLGCAMPELPTTQDFQTAVAEVCAHAWHTLYVERQHYFLRKQSQLTTAIMDSNLEVTEQIEVLGWFSAHFQPTYTGHFTGGSRQLARILQTRMPQDLQAQAVQLVNYTELAGCELQKLARLVVLKTQKLV